MTERELQAREAMQDVAHSVKELLPEGMGFIVLAFDFGALGTMNYVSNAHREDATRALKEFCDNNPLPETEGKN